MRPGRPLSYQVMICEGDLAPAAFRRVQHLLKDTFRCGSREFTRATPTTMTVYGFSIFKLGKTILSSFDLLDGMRI